MVSYSLLDKSTVRSPQGAVKGQEGEVGSGKWVSKDDRGKIKIYLLHRISKSERLSLLTYYILLSFDTCGYGSKIKDFYFRGPQSRRRLPSEARGRRSSK